MHSFRYTLAVLLSALISLQALATVAAPCSPAVDDGGAMATAMDDSSHHAHHGMAVADNAAGAATNDCCDAGYCSQGGCVSIAAAAGAALLHADQLSTEAPAAMAASSPLHSPNRLFRPPSA
ncbi:hypothetical protein DWB85_07520 [Seongchinamella sediminis]|uniref:CopL family metal-binding regulatory protein n=1 Tax=Seongchinamella sediminis TaxID=2283635 RepID=A0A3L7E154_9GAMM|nr:hypothetical protein DWB85_07520 [Seongchinamella sediminis]